MKVIKNTNGCNQDLENSNTINTNITSFILMEYPIL